MDARIRNLLFHRLANLTTERRGDREVGVRREGGVRRNPAEEPLNRRDNLRLINVANDCKYRVIRRIPSGEEVAHIFKARCVQILHGSDRWVVIRMARRVCEGKEFKVCRPIWLVVVA